MQHDGTGFGLQEIHDGPFLLTTSFVKRIGGSNGGDWTARISVEVKDSYKQVVNEEVSLIWYVALDENSEGFIIPSNKDSPLTGVRGETPGLKDFSIKIFNQTGKAVFCF